MIEKPWYEKSITTMAALALFWPAGILLLWRHHSWSKGFNAALTALFALVSAAVYYGGAHPLEALLVVSIMTGGVLLVISTIGFAAGGLTGAATFASRRACRLATIVLLVATAIPLLIVGPEALLGGSVEVTDAPPPERDLTDEDGHLLIFLEDFRFTVDKGELIIQADTNLADGMILLVRLYPQCPDRMRTLQDFVAKLEDPRDLIQEAAVADGLLEVRYDISMFSTPVGFFIPMVAESAPHNPDLDFQPDHVKELYGERLQRISLESDDVYKWYHHVDDVQLEHRGIWIEFLLVYDGYRVRHEKVDPP